MNVIKRFRPRAFSSTLLVAEKSSKRGWKDRRKFVDYKKVHVRGGKGGDGITSFKHPTSSKVRVGGPDGGDGGGGGGVIFKVDTSVKSLQSLQTYYKACDGGNGQASYHTGKNGKDVIVSVPPGTLIRNHLSSTQDILFDLTTHGSSCMIVRGGEGGLGNAMFSSTEERKPIESTLGSLGEEKVIEVELRTIADVGLVGFPNAGKSTLLRALSRATPKVASYPFTTINPQIGVMEGKEKNLTVADIPGLIPGAHANRGLGHYFLRHIQRCSVLLYVLDASNPDTNMATQLFHLKEELEFYDSNLTRNCRMIIANKMDTRTKQRGCGLNVDGNFEEDVYKLYEDTGLPVIPISAHLQWNIQTMKEALFRIMGYI